MGKNTLRLLLACIAVSTPLLAQQPSGEPVAARVETLIGQMTLDEKITLLAGVDDFYTRPIERLGIPRIKMTDGPNGTRVFGKSTAYPAGMLLAATWDPAMAQREGEQLGRDAKARGCHVLLGPGINIYRHPRCGRNFEYFGEDPLLAGMIAVGYVKGVESQGVSATVKHFAANNQENDRMTGSSEMDERTLREIYLPAFKRVIEAAKPGALMCSYNRINGTYSSENRWLLTDVLRGEWKYDGVLMSDWGAVHGTIGPLVNGLDLEMPWPAFLKVDAVKSLIDNGVVSQAVIDEKVRRLLTWMSTRGWLDRDVTDSSIALDNPEGAKVARDVARGGLTLLKNDNALLPLDKSKLKHVVLLGPNAENTPVGGGGSGYTEPFRSVSIADGLRAALGKDRVSVIVSDSTSKLVAAPAVDGGVFRVEYFPNAKLEGEPTMRRQEKTIDFVAASGADKSAIDGMPPGNFSARYSATITPAVDAEYTFYSRADDGVRVLLDGKPMIDDWSDHQARVQTAIVPMQKGTRHELAIEYYDVGGEAALRFGCGPMPATFEAVDLAALHDADAVIFCAGFSQRTESEGSDRTYELPEDQNALIFQAVEQNPRTLVILNAGGSCDMTSWIDRVPALLHSYYAGQEGGAAIADVLLGDVNPSGRLPFTIEKSLADVPSEGNWGQSGVVEYAEGVFVGYRGFDRKKIEPRFPFGFGLSYTRFEIGRTTVRREGDHVIVGVDVSNVGKRDGATVVQCYVQPPAIDVPRPERELRGFEKIQLKAGERKQVEIKIARSDLAYWDPKSRAWTVTSGDYRFHVGFDSRDLPKATTLHLP